MTGPARFAWIITVLVVLMIPHAAVYGAAPRDAVKHLPQLTHISQFRTISDDESASHTYHDNYVGTWRLNWRPPALDLGSARLALEFDYELKLGDRLDRMQASSADARTDKLIARLKVLNSRAIAAHFEIEQSSDLGSGALRSWHPQTKRNAHVSWKEDGFPSFSVDHTATDTYQYAGARQVHGSESAETHWRANYRYEKGRALEDYRVLVRSLRTRTHLTEQTGTSNNTTQLDARRRIKLEPLGTLTLDCHYEEHTKSGLIVDTHRIESITRLGTSLDGSVRGSPASYLYNYTTEQHGFSDSPGKERVRRKVRLDLAPPVPIGKRAGLGYEHSLDDNTGPSQETTVEKQLLTWSFAPNTRTEATFRYDLEQTTDRLSYQRTRDKQELRAGLTYRIPGERGRIDCSLFEVADLQPDKNRRSTASGFNITTSFALGPRTNMNLFFDQRYDDPSTAMLLVPNSKEYFRSGVAYITSGDGVTLNAVWQQYYSKWLHSGRKTDTQKISLDLTYQPMPNWKYELVWETNDESSLSGANVGYDYGTHDEITAMVVYTF